MKNIRAITLWRPWPWAITEQGKDIENRTWQPYPSQLQPGDYLAIHAGKRWDAAGAAWIEETFGVPVPAGDYHPSGAIMAVCRYGGAVTASASPWFVGPVGWRLTTAVAIGPIECRGAQGLWKLPDDVLAQVREAYRTAVALLPA